MNALGRLFQLHHAGAFTNCTLWDAWLPQATVWTGPARAIAIAIALTRRIDEEGMFPCSNIEGWRTVMVGHSQLGNKAPVKDFIFRS